jgi:hypothetical protein
MGKKNPELCECRYCRNAWTHWVSGMQSGRSWTMRVCVVHAKDYTTVELKDSTGRLVQVQPRKS